MPNKHQSTYYITNNPKISHNIKKKKTRIIIKGKKIRCRRLTASSQICGAEQGDLEPPPSVAPCQAICDDWYCFEEIFAAFTDRGPAEIVERGRQGFGEREAVWRKIESRGRSHYEILYSASACGSPANEKRQLRRIARK